MTGHIDQIVRNLGGTVIPLGRDARTLDPLHIASTPEAPIVIAGPSTGRVETEVRPKGQSR